MKMLARRMQKERMLGRIACEFACVVEHVGRF